MGEMTAGIAHEINQPLGAIANYAQGCVRRLRAGPLDAGTLLPVIEESGAVARRAGESIRRLRDLVRQDGGRLWGTRNPDRGATVRCTLPCGERAALAGMNAAT
jgi:signal transduction histidine kinase